MFVMGLLAVCDVKKWREKIFKCFAESASKKNMFIRKTLKEGKSKELYLVLLNWFFKCVLILK